MTHSLTTRRSPLEQLDEGDPEALGEAAVDEEVDGGVHDEEEVVDVSCAGGKTECATSRLGSGRRKLVLLTVLSV